MTAPPNDSCRVGSRDDLDFLLVELRLFATLFEGAGSSLPVMDCASARAGEMVAVDILDDELYLHPSVHSRKRRWALDLDLGFYPFVSDMDQLLYAIGNRKGLVELLEGKVSSE